MVKVGKFRRALKRLRRKRVKTAMRRAGIKRRRTIVNPKRAVSMGKGFPAKIVMTHKYVETVTLSSPAVASYNAITYRANGMFDPRVAAGGHQPLGFDQMSALYNHWTVIGARVRFKVVRDKSSDSRVIQLCSYLDDDATLPGSYEQLLEQNRLRSVVMGAANSTGEGERYVTLTTKFSARKQFGTGALSKDSLQGSATADPAEQSFFVLAITSPSAVAQGVVVQVEIDYLAVWTEVKDIAQS